MSNMGRMTIGILALAWVNPTWAVGTPEQKCQAAKLKALGAVRLCLQKQKANVILGKDDASAACRDKFSIAKTKADAKATAAGTSCRYIDNGDSTVTDLNTGLIWEMKNDAGGIHDKDNTYTWSTSGSTPNGTAFTTFLYALNGQTSEFGDDIQSGCFTDHCDWRLPTSPELLAILDGPQGCSGKDPCIDDTFGPTVSNPYLTATTASDNSLHIWTVFFGSTAVALDVLKSDPTYVRAVRGEGL